MSKKKNITSYQFLINEPISKPTKKIVKTKSNIKKTLEKRGLSTKPEWTFSFFNLLLKKKGNNGENN